MRPTVRTLGRRRASVRNRRAWTTRYLAPARPCRGCGCGVRYHLAARTGAACSRGCGCLGLSTARRENGHRPRTPRRLRPDQVGGMREYLADLDRSIARVRRGLVAFYAWVARLLSSVAEVVASLRRAADDIERDVSDYRERPRPVDRVHVGVGRADPAVDLASGVLSIVTQVVNTCRLPLVASTAASVAVWASGGEDTL